MEMTPKRIAFLVLALIFAVFVAQNAQVLEVRFLFWSTQVSRALVLLGTFILGLIVGWVSRWAWRKGQESAKKGRLQAGP
jgi:putative membrane protein